MRNIRIILGMIAILVLMQFNMVLAFASTDGVIKLEVGQSEQIYTMIQTVTGYDQVVSPNITVLDPNIAHLSSSGVITALKPGRTRLELSANVAGAMTRVSIEVNVLSDIKDFSLDKSSVTVQAGNNYDVPYTLSLNSGVDQNQSYVNWSSDNIEVASIDGNGVVSVYGIGKAVITAATVDGQFEEKFNLTGTPADERLIVNNGYAKILKVGEVFSPMMYSSSYEINSESVKGISLTPQTCKMLENGDVKAIAGGDGRVLYVDTEHHISTVLSVKSVPTVEGIEIEKESLLFNELEQSQEVHYQLIPTETQDQVYETGVLWTTQNPNIATVSDGLVTAHDYGITKVVAKTVDGSRMDSIWIRVEKEIDSLPIKTFESIELNRLLYEAYVGEEINLNIKTVPEIEDLSQIEVTVLKGPSSQIELREDGYYFIPSEITRNVIYVRTPDGKVDHDSIYVRSAISSIRIPNDMIKISKYGKKAIYIGQEIELKYILDPARDLKNDDIINKDVVWKSSDPSVIEVIGNKNILGKKIGESTLTVMTEDGLLEDEIEIGVHPITLGFAVPREVELNVGDIYKPEAAYRMIYGYEKPFYDEFEIEVTGYAMLAEEVKLSRDYYLQKADELGYETSIEYYKYKKQATLYSEILKLENKGYCKVSADIISQLFDESPFVKVSGSLIHVLRPGRIDLSVKSLENEQVRSMSILSSASGDEGVLTVIIDGVKIDKLKGE